MTTTLISARKTAHSSTTTETVEGAFGYDLTRYALLEASELSNAEIEAMTTVVVDGWCFSTSNEVGSEVHTIRCWRNLDSEIYQPARHEIDGWKLNSRTEATRIGLMVGVLARFNNHRKASKQVAQRPATPLEGIDRCPCGSKYWDGVTCHSCGETFKPDAT